MELGDLTGPGADEDKGYGDNLAGALREAQLGVYREALARTGGNKAGAARLLGLRRATFANRLKALLESEVG